MSAYKKPTRADLERLLAEPLETAQETSVWDAEPYLKAAAVLAVFDPYNWDPDVSDLMDPARRDLTSRHLDDAGRDALLKGLLPFCEQITIGPQHGLWQITAAERRYWLRELATRERMRTALAATAIRPDTPTQHLFEQIINDEDLDLAALTRDELAALVSVLDWIDGILDPLPHKAEVLAALARADMRVPLLRLVRDGFVNRLDELRQLNDYLHRDVNYSPLFVFGSGGVGKSTLLAQFILENVDKEGIPYAYIDIDRPTIQADQPLTILIEIINQLAAQMPFHQPAIESLIFGITRLISRQEGGRYLEGVKGIEIGYLQFSGEFAQALEFALEASPARPREALIVIDTLEEAQWLGEDVERMLFDFLSEFAARARLRLILSGRVLPQAFVDRFFWNELGQPEDGDLLLEERLFRIPQPVRPIDVNVLADEAARDLLAEGLHEKGQKPLDDAELDEIVGIVSRNPMCLKLAVRLIKAVGVDQLRRTRTQFLARLKAEKIQALLYGRILHHIHHPQLVKIAYPGLVVRRITPDVIREVLAAPCELDLSGPNDEYALAGLLRKEVALVRYDPRDGSLRHRTDVRRAMLVDLTDHVDEEVVEAIDRAAVAYYNQASDGPSRAEEIYHRLRLGESLRDIETRWLDEAAPFLKDAGQELPAGQQLWLAEQLGRTVEDTVRQLADQEAWEDQAARAVDRMLSKSDVTKALAILEERDERLPRSELYALHAEAYRLLGIYDEALRIGREGVDDLSGAGAIDMTAGLLFKLVAIEEARGNLDEALALSDEADAVVAHSSDDLLRLRALVNRLRIYRKMGSGVSEKEITLLRSNALALLVEHNLEKLRPQPVLLRETAAELGAGEPRLTRIAINTLGLEASTHSQELALANVLNSALQETDSLLAEDAEMTDFVRQVTEDTVEDWIIRDWIYSRESRLVRELSQLAGESLRLSGYLAAWQDYFRSGVELALADAGEVFLETGHYSRAMRFFEQRLPLVRKLGDTTAEARTLNDMGVIYLSAGELDEAQDSFEKALALRRAAADLTGQGQALNNLGLLYQDRGETGAALEMYGQALDVYGEAGDLAGENAVLKNLSEIGQSPEQASGDVLRTSRVSAAMRNLVPIADLSVIDVVSLHEQGMDKSTVLLERGTTPGGRARLARDTGVSEEAILVAVKEMDLMRLSGVGVLYAALLLASGVETVPDLARRNPANLVELMTKINQEEHIVKDLPSVERVAKWSEQAKELPRILNF